MGGLPLNTFCRPLHQLLARLLNRLPFQVPATNGAKDLIAKNRHPRALFPRY